MLLDEGKKQNEFLFNQMKNSAYLGLVVSYISQRSY